MKLMRCSPRMPVSISELEKEPLEEDCCDDEDCVAPEPIVEEHTQEEELPQVLASSGEILREILLSENVSDRVIEKYAIIETFEGWYKGTPDTASVRASIQDFKSAAGGVINAKLSRVQ